MKALAPREPSGAAGTVLVIGADGALYESETEYDTRAAGVVAGAGCYRPGIILDKQRTSAGRLSVSLVGKVFCKVDGAHGAIEVGDLLTTSPTPGHAMKAIDPRARVRSRDREGAQVVGRRERDDSDPRRLGLVTLP